MKAILIGTYEMGRQSFGLASPAAWLKADGWDVVCADLSKERLAADALAGAELVAFHLPMHTATRLAAPVIRRIRSIAPAVRLCAYGLYAPLNDAWLRSLGIDAVFGGEFEEELTRWAGTVHKRSGDKEARDLVVSCEEPPVARAPAPLPRLQFIQPDRSGLPALSKYATLQMPDGTRRLVGYTEASRGCKHVCRHCPVVPIYQGQFRVVQAEVVAADVAAQVAAGARHITFGDPDFFNGPAHAVRIVEALHRAHPDVTYDVTIKVEHLLAQRDLLPRLAATGCAFVTCAVESIDDAVLALLDKGHTREGFVETVGLCRGAGLTLVPTFVAFHPWLTLDGYCALLDTIEDLDLVDHVASIQLAIRLLVPEGSRLLTLDAMRPHLGRFDPSTLTYRWMHPDPRVDDLQRAVSAIVGARLNANRRTVFDEVSALAHERAGRPAPRTRPARDRATVPYLNEPWYC